MGWTVLECIIAGSGAESKTAFAVVARLPGVREVSSSLLICKELAVFSVVGAATEVAAEE